MSEPGLTDGARLTVVIVVMSYAREPGQEAAVE